MGTHGKDHSGPTHHHKGGIRRRLNSTSSPTSNLNASKITSNNAGGKVNSKLTSSLPSIVVVDSSKGPEEQKRTQITIYRPRQAPKDHGGSSSGQQRWDNNH